LVKILKFFDADPDPRIFLTREPGWKKIRIRDIKFRIHFIIFLKFLDADPDPRIFLTLDPGWKKFESGIKHFGSTKFPPFLQIVATQNVLDQREEEKWRMQQEEQAQQRAQMEALARLQEEQRARLRREELERIRDEKLAKMAPWAKKEGAAGATAAQDQKRSLTLQEIQRLEAEKVKRNARKNCDKK
jgi:hypothetical protein